MPKYFPGITHSTVHTITDKTMMEKMNGTIATVHLYFGPGDEEAITLVSIKKMTGPTPGVTAHIPRTPVLQEEKTKYVPVFTGKAADELKMLALVAFDKVKSSHGIKFNKNYRVTSAGVEEVPTQVGV